MNSSFYGGVTVIILYIVKFGVLKDEKFAKKVEPAILFKSIYDNYLTLEDLKKSEHKPLEETDENADKENVVEENATSENKAEENAKKEINIYYVTDIKAQSQYINLFKESNKEAVIFTHNIDTPFISRLEMNNEGLKFKRIDADINDSMKGSEESDEALKEKQSKFADKVK